MPIADHTALQYDLLQPPESTAVKNYQKILSCLHLLNEQESRAIAGRTARCRRKFRYKGFMLKTPPIFHPNFGGVPVGLDRPCWGQPEHKPYANQP